MTPDEQTRQDAVDDVVVTQALVPGACATVSAGPPPIPDGASVPGMPLLVSKAGSDVTLTWDSAPGSTYKVTGSLTLDTSTVTGQLDLVSSAGIAFRDLAFSRPGS